MKEKVYISGHRNPDTDSICAALAYADLKNKISDYQAVPIRLGDINRETQFVLDYFGVDQPIFMDTIKSEVRDLKLDSPFILSPDTSCAKALEFMQEKNVDVFAVDSEEKLMGIVSLSNITKNIWTCGTTRSLGIPIRLLRISSKFYRAKRSTCQRKSEN